MSDENLKREFQNFCDPDLHEGTGPRLRREFSKQIDSDLNPRQSAVFLKLLFIHVATSVATLAVCPQFGFQWGRPGHGLMKWFMVLGRHGCLVACGIFFLGMSAVVASLVMKRDELRILRQNRWLSLSALALLSLGFFIMIDAQLILSLAAAWYLGALLGSASFIELGWRMRRPQFRH